MAPADRVDALYAPEWAEIVRLVARFVEAPADAARKAELLERLRAIRDLAPRAGRSGGAPPTDAALDAIEAHTRLAMAGLKAIVAAEAAAEGHPLKAAGLRRECRRILRRARPGPETEAVRALVRRIP